LQLSVDNMATAGTVSDEDELFSGLHESLRASASREGAMIALPATKS
jgi:hypothetical protein